MFIPQALGALDVAVGVGGTCLGGGDLGFGTLHFGRIGRGVDRDQQVALLDQRAFAEVHRLHRAGDPRADVDPLDGFEPAGELVPGRHLALHDGGHRDGRGLRRGRGVGDGVGRLQAEDGARDGGERSECGGGGPQTAADGETFGLHVVLRESNYVAITTYWRTM
jgi:hypothetical protein